MIGWGSTEGSIKTAVEHKQAAGKSVSRVHLKYINPLPNDLGDIIKRFKKVLVPEINAGQLVHVLRSRYLVDAISYGKLQGLPFFTSEIEDKIDEILGE